MKTILRAVILLFIFIVVLNAEATESCEVSGFVTDSATGEAIAGANLMIQGYPYGDAANIHGFYTIPVLPKGGPYTLVVSAIGYRRIEKKIYCDGKPQRMDFELAQEAIRAEKIVVEAKRVGGMEDPMVGHTIIESKFVENTPSLVESDLFRAIQLLPGVLAISDFTTGLYIWGSSPGENLILLDNIEVYNPTHLMGFFSTFIVEGIREANLVKGGYPAKWGGRLGSVLEVTNKDGNRKNFEGMAELSLLSGKFLFEGPVKRGSYMLAGRRTWIDAATKLMEKGNLIEEAIPYYFYDLQGRINQDLSERDKVTVSVYAGDDILAIENEEDEVGNDPPPDVVGDSIDYYEEEDEDFEYRWGNITLSGQWTHIFNEKLFGHMVLAGSRFRAKLGGMESDDNLNNRVHDISLKGDLSYFYSDKHTFNFGGMLKWREVHYEILDVETDQEGDTVEISAGNDDFYWEKYSGASLIALYGEEEYKPGIMWRFQAGLRAEFVTNGYYFRVGPRFSGQRKLDALTTLRFACGRYYQYIHLHNPLEDVGFAVLDVWVPVDSNLKPGQADHLAVGLDTDHLPVHLSTNAYYKRMHHLIEVRDQFLSYLGDDIHSVFFEASGWAAGMDLTLQGNVGPFTGWVGYGLGWTKRRTAGKNNGDAYYPKYDRRHSIKLSLGVALHPRLKGTIAFNYGTGQPSTDPVDFIKHEEWGYTYYEPVFEEGLYHNGRLPDYHRLDLGLVWTIHKGKWKMDMYVQVLNVYNRRNVLIRDWYNWEEPEPEDQHMLPLIPTFGFRAEF
ncbi:TonB-dependent receptor [bacterium]|nr:TonB-dependent receptor [bacterium]